MKPRMSSDEVDLFISFLRLSKNYLEFGTGGSTLLATKYVKNRILSIDSDINWIKKIRKLLNRQSVILKHCDIGKIGNWGYPINIENKIKFLNYHEKILSKLKRNFNFDLVLIDGRFRIACAALVSGYACPNTIILIHDYRSRKQLHVVESFLSPICESSDLTAFVLKKTKLRIINKIYQDNKFNPD